MKGVNAITRIGASRSCVVVAAAAALLFVTPASARTRCLRMFGDRHVDRISLRESEPYAFPEAKPK